MSQTDIIQDAQTMLGQVQMTYRDSELPFYALAVAWEAARFAWYVADGDVGTAQDKLTRLKEAITDFERMLAKKRKDAGRST